MNRRRFLRGTALAGLAAGCVEVEVPDGVDTGGDTPTPPADPQFPEDVRERARGVGEEARESVVVAEADRPGPTAATGAAWFVESSVLATTAHGVADADSIAVWTLDGDSADATVLGRSNGAGVQADDVAALEIDGEGPALPTGDSGSLADGQPLVHVGHPYAVGNWVVSIGRFVGTRGDDLLSTLPTMSGNSGSPVLTLDGDVVGMTTGSVPREQEPRRRGQAPEPAPAYVHEEYEDATYGYHHAVETVEDYVEEWG